MNPFEMLIDLLSQYGLPGLSAGLVVLLAVFFLKRGGVIVSGDWARIANVILSVFVAGLDPTNPEIGATITAALASIVSALIYEITKWLSNRFLPDKYNGFK